LAHTPTRIVLASIVTTATLIVSLTSPAAATTQAEAGYLVTGDSPAAVEAALDRVGESGEILEEVDAAAADLSASEAAALDKLPGIDVALDIPVSTTDTQTEPGWALDRIDQTKPVGGTDGALHRQYWYPASAGSGVRVYVVDTGVNNLHVDVAGRVISGFDAFGATQGWNDCDGHGTAVASAAAGIRNGVAKSATIVPVRVLDCTGGGTTSSVLSGINWILANHPSGTPAVVNFSLAAQDASGTSSAAALLDSGVTALHDAGLTVVAAAGNDSTATSVVEACINTPARVPAILTVGAFERAAIDGQDARSSFSNGGQCVDGFAPGTAVPVAIATGGHGAANGTSFASPLVAGMAALLLAENPALTPSAVQQQLLAAAQSGGLHDGPLRPLSGTTISANSIFLAPIAAPRPVTGPAGVRVVDVTRSTVTLAWDSPSAGVLVRFAGTRSAAVDGTTATLTGLTAGTSYTFDLFQSSDGLYGETATVVPAVVTQSATSGPSAPRNVAVTPTGFVTWTAPTATYSEVIRTYRLMWKQTDGAWAEADVTGTVGAQIPAPLTGGVEYQVAVRADTMTKAGAWSAPVSFIAESTPIGPVTNVRATPGVDRLTVAWTAPGAGFAPATSYLVSWSGSNGTAGEVTTSTTTATLTGLSASTSYDVSVAAVTATGVSEPASATFATLTPTPSAVRSLTVGIPGGGKVPLTWTAPLTSMTAVTDYRVTVSTDGGETWVPVSDAVTATTGASVPIAASTSYAFRVVAVNSYGTGTPATVTWTSPSVPGTATAVRATTVTPTAVGLAWTAAPTAGPAVTDYLVWYSLDRGVSWKRFVDPVSAVTTATVTGLTQTSTVLFQVAAVNSMGAGAPSASLTVTTLNGRPSAPRSFRATAVYRTSVNLAWSTPASSPYSAIRSYLIQRSTNGGASWTTIQSKLSTARSTSVTGLIRGTRYMFRVIAVNGFGQSLPATISVTTAR
jgi:subtilisin family serine protease